MIKMRVHLLFITLSASASLFTGAANAQIINDWENPNINGINKKQPHAYTFLTEEKSNNLMIRSLNGIWKFKWFPYPHLKPISF